ncbi:hypothetical protein PoB_007711000, partial [Plakobranchus ocellatus]
MTLDFIVLTLYINFVPSQLFCNHKRQDDVIRGYISSDRSLVLLTGLEEMKIHSLNSKS